ncbi:hypothetical protein UFOVP48_85 [uncultured Caudovirales phage]|uniref:Uncharacterized protein n=1 Tax=uncultured Caudovirales phage TaxID=2100421 RepID=A0A6J5KUB2_9CAUD|nr:hypothetical protein UFOVP48_85 [uncultured Caudovirales phage]
MAKQTNYSPTFPMFPGGAVTFTQSDTVNLPTPSVIYVGVTGDVKVTTAQGDNAVFVAVPAGQVIPVQVIRVWTTGTTASSMLRIY